MIILNADDVKKSLPMTGAIMAMKVAYATLSSGKAEVPLRSRLEIGRDRGTCLFMPSFLQSEQGEALAVKAVSVFPGNIDRGLPTIHAAVLVFDPHSGKPVALLEGSTLTAIRTGAASGAATDLLARPEAHTAAIFGAGVQGRTQTWAACTVRDIERVYVYDLYPEARERFAEDMTEKLGIEVTPANSGEEACRDADIVLTATTSPKPVVKRKWLKDRVHVSAIGAFYPDWRELDTATVAGSKLVIDDMEGIRLEAGDVLIPIEEGAMTWDNVHAELKDIVSGKKTGRTSEDGVTVFKSVGIAIQDSSVANLVLRKLRL